MKDSIRILLGIIFFLTFVLVFVGLVAGEFIITVHSPLSSSTVGGGTVIMLINFTGQPAENTGAFNGVVNVSIFALSTLTANSSHVRIQNNLTFEYNITLGTNVTINITTLGIEDANNYDFFINITNATSNIGASWGTSTLTSMTVDNTIPQAPTSLTSETFTNSSPIITSTVVGAEVTSCLIVFTRTFPGATKSSSMIHSGNTCSISTITYPEGVYPYVVQANDGTNQTNSTESVITISIPSGKGAKIILQSQQQQQQRGNTFFIIAIIVAIALVVIFRKK